MRRLLILTAAAVLAAIAQAACDTRTTCDTCTTSNSGTCGWAADQGACLSGTSLGPTGTTSTDWMWVSADCNCLNAYTCSSCTLISGCGWINGNTCGVDDAAGAVTWCNNWSYDVVSSATGLGVGIILVIIFVPVVFIIAVTTTVCIICNRRRAVVVAPAVGYNTYGVAQPIAGGGAVGVVAYA